MRRFNETIPQHNGQLEIKIMVLVKILCFVGANCHKCNNCWFAQKYGVESKKIILVNIGKTGSEFEHKTIKIKEVKIFKNIVTITFASLLFTACATVPLEIKELLDKTKEFNSPSEGNAGLYIFRSKGVVAA